MIDPQTTPLRNHTLIFRNLTNGRVRIEDNPVKTDEKGEFKFSGKGHNLYEVNLIISEQQAIFRGIGTIDVVDGHAVEMGDVVLKFSVKNQPMVRVQGPTKVTLLLPRTNATNPTPSRGPASAISAI